MRITTNAQDLTDALAAIVPFVNTKADAGPDGMVHLSYVASGGLVVTAYGHGLTVAWVDAESEDGALGSFAIDRRDAGVLVSSFSRSLGSVTVDVEAKVLEAVGSTSVAAANVVSLNGEVLEERQTVKEYAYAITVAEDGGLFGNRVVRVATAAQPETDLERLWAALYGPLAARVEPHDEYRVPTGTLGRFRAAERAYERSMSLAPADDYGGLLVRVGTAFAALVYADVAADTADEERETWLERLPWSVEVGA